MATHSSILAWRIPGAEEPGGLPSMESHRVGHELKQLSMHAWRRKWQPTPMFLPGESQGRQSLVGCRLWGRTESDTTEAMLHQQQQQQQQQQRVKLLGTSRHSPTGWVKVGGGASSSLRNIKSSRGISSFLSTRGQHLTVLATGSLRWNLESRVTPRGRGCSDW